MPSAPTAIIRMPPRAQVGTPVAPALQASLTGVSGYDTAGVQRPADPRIPALLQVPFRQHQ